MSFRTRLMLASLLTLAIGLTALVVIGNIVLGNRIDQQAADVLRERVQAEVASLSITPDRIVVRETPNDAALDRSSWVFEGSRILERPPSVDPVLDRSVMTLGRDALTVREVDGPGDVRLREQPLRVGGAQPPVGAVVVAYDASDLERVEQEVLIGSIIVSLLVLAAGAVAIVTAVSGALRPVAEMTTTAQAWSAADLDRRFDLGPERDELTRLAATLDGLLARIAASRRHEQRFASEVAHELRTPLAALRARAELALAADGDDSEAERTQALRTVVDQSDRLTAAVDALVAMARQETDSSGGDADPVAIAMEFELPVYAPDQLPRVEGDPELLRRMLAPLIDNARAYALSHISLRLRSEGASVEISVCDDGPGFASSGDLDVFEPGVRDAARNGAGLGLPLARRIARSCGGDVMIGLGPGGEVVITLPSVAPQSG